MPSTVVTAAGPDGLAAIFSASINAGGSGEPCTASGVMKFVLGGVEHSVAVFSGRMGVDGWAVEMGAGEPSKG